MKCVLAVENVRKAYRDHSVIGNVSFRINEGHRVALMGPSGCGKSTLLRMLAGLERPDAGQISLKSGALIKGGKNVIGVGYLTQRPTLLPWMSVTDNVLLPIALNRRPTQHDRLRASELLKAVQLLDVANERPYRLSGGMQQRVSLAQALLCKPGILLLDEPFNGLDDLTRRELLIRLHQILRDADTAMILVTHSFEDAVFLCNDAAFWEVVPGVGGSILFDKGSADRNFDAECGLRTFANAAFCKAKDELFERYVRLNRRALS